LKEKVYYRIDMNETELVDARLEIKNTQKVLSSIQTLFSKDPNHYFSYKSLMDSIEHSFNYSASEFQPQQPKPRRKNLEAKSFGADNVYTLGDYQAFLTMKDIVVEILSKAKLKTINGKNRIRVLLEDENSKSPLLAKGDPLFIIDGVPTNNTDYFFGVKPSQVEKIKIIWKIERSVLKSFGRNGVIIVETKEPTTPAPIPALNSFYLSGFSSPLPFETGAPKNLSDKRIPYFKSCLYWDPSIKFDKAGLSNLSFFASDDLGEYVIDVEGLTADGVPFYNRSSFTIVPENKKIDLNEK
jgi:hypothetical protein